MNEQNGRTNSATGVGSRVKVTVRGPNSGGVANTGVVIEDNANIVIDSESVGRDWARCIGGKRRVGVQPHGFELRFVFSEDWRERFAWIAGNRSEYVMVAENAVLGKFHGSVSHIIDIENLCGGDVAGQASDVWALYLRLVGVSDADQITVAANRSNAVPAFFALPHTARRILVPNEPDAADKALVAAVDASRISRLHATVVIASGDGYFTGLAVTLREAGLKVVQVATRGIGVSAGLYVKCHDFISLPNILAEKSVVRPLDRSHLRVRSASERRSSLAVMTARSHGAVPPRTPMPSDPASA